MLSITQRLGDILEYIKPLVKCEKDSTGANVAGIQRPGADPVICVHQEKARQKRSEHQWHSIMLPLPWNDLQ